MESTSTRLEGSVDDDGRRRTGTVWSAMTYIITAVIGTAVLTLPWSTAQLGWVGGSIALMFYTGITWFACVLLANCHRSPDPIHGKRNYTYMEEVKTILGKKRSKFCGFVQYAMMVGHSIAYTITASISMVAVKRSNCFHAQRRRDGCHTSNDPFILIFAGVQVFLSQIPNFDKLSFISPISAIMSFIYSFIGLGLIIAHIAGAHHHPSTSITGVPIGPGMSGLDKMWRVFSALGNIAFAYDLSTVLVSIQDTLKSSKPENKVMKQATSAAIILSSLLYFSCGLLGYAAFGSNAPGNLLTGFGFFEPFWLVDFANVCIVVQLFGGYQVFTLPFYEFVEDVCANKWPESKFLAAKISLPFFHLSIFKLIWRKLYVVVTTVVVMVFPNFNDVVGLLGALSFWPLTVYFPFEMHIVQFKIQRFSWKWIGLKVLSVTCLTITLVASAASIRGLIKNIHTLVPFNSES